MVPAPDLSSSRRRFLTAGLFAFAGLLTGAAIPGGEKPRAKDFTLRLTDGRALGAKGFFFHDAYHSIRVLDLMPEPGKYAGFAAAMEEAGAVAGINGGFFTPEAEPLGLMVTDGRATGALRSSALTSGVWIRTPCVLLLLRVAEFRARRGALEPTQLIQSGPFLVDGGNPVAGLEPTQSRPRSLVVHDMRHRWMLIQTPSVTLAALGEALAREGAVPDVPVVRALNLDGGNSCGWFVAAGNHGRRASSPPLRRVRNAVAIVPK